MRNSSRSPSLRGGDTAKFRIYARPALATVFVAAPYEIGPGRSARSSAIGVEIRLNFSAANELAAGFSANATLRSRWQTC